MEFTRKMSKKGVVTIPKYFRNKFGLHPGTIVILRGVPEGIRIIKKNQD